MMYAWEGLELIATPAYELAKYILRQVPPHGPAGAAAGWYIGSTTVTKVMDKFWMNTVNTTIFSSLGVWP